MKKAFVTFGAVILAGIFLILAVRCFISFNRSVSVRGLCEREVKADVAIYPISFRESGNDLISLYNNVSKKNQIILDFLESNGISEDEITIGVPVVTDRQSEGYYQGGLERYTLKSTVTVYTKQVDNVLALQRNLSTLIEKGIALSADDWSNPITYQFASLNEIKPEMIQEANQNARQAADQFAKDSKSRVGKIKNAEQGLFSIENRDINTPYIKKVRVVTYVTYQLK